MVTHAEERGERRGAKVSVCVSERDGGGGAPRRTRTPHLGCGKLREEEDDAEK